MWPLRVAVEDPVEQERHPGGDGEERDDEPGAGEDPQRLVAGVDAQDRERVAAHVGAGRVEEPRLARLRVGLDRDLVDGDQHLARLDQALQRVGEVVDDEQAERGLAVVGAEAGGRVGDLGPREPAHDPAAQPLQGFLEPEKCSIWLTWRSPTTMSASPARIGATSLAMSAPLVLVVGVGVDDDVGAELEAGVEARPGSRPPGPCCWSAGRCARRRARGRPRPCGRSSRRRSTSSSISSMPSICRGMSATVAGSVASSSRQGIWIISFTSGSGYPRARPRVRPCGRGYAWLLTD